MKAGTHLGPYDVTGAPGAGPSTRLWHGYQER